ncbi:MAG: TIGR00180 family glycosyltransferase [Candidatus Hermodarchaeota archaeon]
MLEKVTLIIPTHNRHHYLTRILDYFSDINLKIFVADSSSRKYPNYKNYKINYFHYPNYTFFEKLSEITQKIETTYALLCADDDFIIPTSIEKCINFLENNKDYSSAQGYYVQIVNENGKINFKPIYTYCKKYIIDANTPEERIIQNMSLYMHLFYSVHRSEYLIQVFSLPPIKNLSLIEIAIAMISLINGKHKMLPIFYCAREYIEESAGKTTPSLINIVKDPNMKNDYENFINSISKYLSKTHGYNMEDSRKYVLKALDCYFNKFVPYFYSFEEAYSSINRRRNLIILLIQVLFPRIHYLIKHKTFSQNYENLSASNYSNFEKIRKSVLFHSNVGRKSPLKRIFSSSTIQKMKLRYNL